MRLRKVFEGLFVAFFIWVHFWLRATVSVTSDIFSLCNSGGLWGIGIAEDVLVYGGVGASIIFFLQWWKAQSFVVAFPWVLLVAGGLGNLLERVRFGCIMDYIALPYFPIFNVADVLLTVGVIGIVMKSLKNKNRK